LALHAEEGSTSDYGNFTPGTDLIGCWYQNNLSVYTRGYKHYIQCAGNATIKIQIKLFNL
jgi:hypothetical protein